MRIHAEIHYAGISETNLQLEKEDRHKSRVMRTSMGNVI